jgi:hypothetical protein
MEAVESLLVRLDDDGMPVPVSVPEDFVVHLGRDDVPDSLDWVMAELLLTWIEWVEIEIRGFPGLLERLRLLRGAVMVAAVVSQRDVTRVPSR